MSLRTRERGKWCERQGAAMGEPSPVDVSECRLSLIASPCTLVGKQVSVVYLTVSHSNRPQSDCVFCLGFKSSHMG